MLIQRNLYEQTSPAAPETAPLAGEHEADFVVIGAGYTGLTAAIHAAGQGTKTLVLEAEEAGFGGSGRNHGHCVPVFGFTDPQGFIEKLGRERGTRYASLLVNSGKTVFSLIERYGIDCEAAPTGALQLAHRPAAMERLKRQHDFYAELGVKPQLLDRQQVTAMTGSDAYYGGWIHPDGGHLNPLALTRGLARAAMREGAEIYTRSPALAIAREAGVWRVTCPGGSVRAKRIGIATNAYTARLFPPLGRSYFTMSAYALASEPLDPALRQYLLPGNQSVGDTRPDVRYLRFDSQNRLIVGGLIETIRGRNIEWSANFMRRRFCEIFPALQQELRWSAFWSGKLAINLDRQPHLYNPAPGLYALVGYSGRGVPLATALGEVLGEAGCGVAAKELPMAISTLRPLLAAPLLSAVVPRLRGPINRIHSLWG
ncbi:NAD(P)/FAD-dependent oxidoreductase [Brenneria corticis]|uniref:FAD-binding oxidoreductase n=1 Tax=Brenneria corticis TaxID=2173106 RepID=A0A2U1TVE0_9GAMM|nr:FAD-dependent oxidoreductase [Brenneria sp. CFCC 11842]PWC13375.1 FAD-binding oxidoreductase [Brenneria sp. CFCC 11842]